MNALPDVLTQNILNRFLNSDGKSYQPVIYIIEAIKKLSVVCKYWNQIILRKLQLVNSIKMKRYDDDQQTFSYHALKLMKHYKINFSIHCSVHDEAFSSYREYVSEIYVDQMVDNYKNENALVEMDSQVYCLLERYNLIDCKDTEMLFTKYRMVRQWNSNLKFSLTHSHTIKKAKDLEKIVIDSKFDRIQFNDCVLSIPMDQIQALSKPIYPLITSLTFKDLIVDQWVIEYLLDCCSQTLERFEFQISDSPSINFNYLVDKLSTTPFPSIKKISLLWEHSCHLQPLIQLITTTNAKKLFLGLVIDNDQQFTDSLSLHNPGIESFRLSQNNYKSFPFPMNISSDSMSANEIQLELFRSYRNGSIEEDNDILTFRLCKFKIDATSGLRQLHTLNFNFIKSSDFNHVLSSIGYLNMLSCDTVQVNSVQDITDLCQAINVHQQLTILYLYKFEGPEDDVDMKNIYFNQYECLINILDNNHIIKEIQFYDSVDDHNIISDEMIDKIADVLTRNHTVIFIGFYIPKPHTGCIKLKEVLNKYMIENYM
ncbi:hypothetical protein DLAC_04932 [Tieghemostelium lacteum]|uniref:F-box domain-containing protein n=1 Tax=Tieghemostelium lacteum TaxID=361077 RepID=A0A151ZHT6_TIELA|nr:hypothetical protein DLAC_04932 [Tieghemostelium lacteum]|eukprot:KYQ93561.1 hypothetical protein DLAC_04932 [Tieghemostelium lacteum]